MQEQSFSERFKAVLKKKKISQVKVSNALGLSRTAVNKWTKGGQIDDHNLEGLAQFLAVDKIWLKYGNTPKLGPQPENGIGEVHLQDSTEIVTWQWDLLSDEVAYSDNVEKVYGVRLQSNQDYWNLMQNADKEKLNNDYQKIIRDGGAHEMDFSINVNGSSRWITSRATGIKGENGKVNRLVGISMDNTERKNKELHLQRSYHFLKALLDNTESIVAFTDLDGEIIETNFNSKQSSSNYPAFQAYIYKAFAANEEPLAKCKTERTATVVYEGQKMIVHYINDADTQPFFMLVQEVKCA